MKLLLQTLAIAAAGALGSLTRFAVGRFFTSNRVLSTLLGAGFPFGTLVINVTGSFLLGWIYVALHGKVINIAGHPVDGDTLSQVIGIGFVGAYTTFSTYMYETNNLLAGGSINKAMVYLVGSIVLGLIAVRVGMRVAAA